MSKVRKIALLGQPNSGKSTLFNTLTGSHQHVGNWPGKTVERKEGKFTYQGIDYVVADLPGTYSLSANSDEEIVTREYIASGEADLVCILADASQLERSLFMLADYVGINTPAMLVLTMTDVAASQGKQIDVKKLMKKLDIPVVAMVAPDRKQYDEFFSVMVQAFENPKSINANSLYNIFETGKKKDEFLQAKALVPKAGLEQYSASWLASKLMEDDKVVAEKIEKATDPSVVNNYRKKVKDGSLYTSDCKFTWIEQLIAGVVTRKQKTTSVLTKFDKLAISRIWGKWLAVGIIILGIAGSMIIAAPIMGLGGAIPSLLNPLVEKLEGVGVASILCSYLSGALVTTLGWVISMVGFVFGINLVFGLIEEVGYMARVSYSFDNTMNKLGLQGKSIMPMLVGFGCTIGGAAGTRVIDSWGQKILTIALVWAVPCGATFAVIPTLASAFFGSGGSILVMIFLFLIMFVHITITAKVFGKKLNPVEERTGLIMELPPYHKPRWGALLRMTLNRVWGVFKKAFTVVIIVASVFWLLSYSPSGNADQTILYKFGTAIEPITLFFGMRWQTFIAFLSSMVAKEAVLGVTSVLFTGNGSILAVTAGTQAAATNIGEVLAASISQAEALAFIVAVTFNVPCLMAVSSTYQETHSLKWTLRIAIYYIVTALILSCIVFHVANLLF